MAKQAAMILGSFPTTSVLALQVLGRDILTTFGGSGEGLWTSLRLRLFVWAVIPKSAGITYKGSRLWLPQGRQPHPTG